MKTVLSVLLVVLVLLGSAQSALARVPSGCGNLAEGDCEGFEWYCLFQCFTQLILDDCQWDPDCLGD